MGYSVPDDLALGPTQRGQLRQLGTLYLEQAVLGGPPDGVDVPSVRVLPRLLELNDQYVEGEVELARMLLSERATGRRLTDFILASEVMDILQVLNDRFAEAAISRGLSPDLDSAEGLTALITGLPSRLTVLELRRQLHENPETRFQPNDLSDIAFLAIAVPYCDVIVTERKWVHHLNRAGLPQRFSTRILSDLAALPRLIV